MTSTSLRPPPSPRAANVGATVERQQSDRSAPIGRDIRVAEWPRIHSGLLTLLAAVALAWFLLQLIGPVLHPLTLFGVSALVAFTLDAPVDVVTGRVGQRRGVAIALVYLAIALACASALLVLSWPASIQVGRLEAELPSHIAMLQEQMVGLTDSVADEQLRLALIAFEESMATAMLSSGPQLVATMPSAAMYIGSFLTDALLVVVVSFYLLLDGERIRGLLFQLLPARNRRAAIVLEHEVTRVLGGYLRAQLLTSLSIGLIVGLGCWLLSLPYAVALGLLAGLLELVPIFGPVLAAVPAVVTALFMPAPTVVYVLLFFVVVQQIECNVLVPRITGRALGLHPVATLFALLAGYQSAGAIGALVAAPCAALMWSIARTARPDLASDTPGRVDRVYPQT
jgi:predicted PurR-regulated permease PerM